MKFLWIVFAMLLVVPVRAVPPPYVVATPPADAARGLVRVDDKEIRHYPGKGGTHFLQSLDNGETWAEVPLPASYPDATCMAKESPVIVRSPVSGEYLRVEPRYSMKAHEGIYITRGGLEGRWERILQADGNPFLPSGILQRPTWVNGNQRIVLPAHSGGCFTWYSDDQGLTWKASNKVQAPHHKAGGIHKGTRWNHGMVEGTVVELKNGKLWLIGRTAQDQHWQTFSEDYGTTWSDAEPSRFWGTITMPNLHRLKDGRLLFLWSNTTSLPEVARPKIKYGEDVFTNRDAIHAAISEDDGATWIGFRELILDELRNNVDYAVTRGSNDRGKHQSEIIQLDDNRVLFSCGQHPLHRRLMIMDLRWLYETKRSSNLAKDGVRDWSTHQYINKIAGHCGYNRKPGAAVDKQGALRVLRVDDPSLTNPNQGAVWNFPSGQTGSMEIKLRLEPGGAGIQLALTDRWFNPTDPTVDQFAVYLLRIDAEGKSASGEPLLQPGKTHTLTLTWKDVAQGEGATLLIDGKAAGLELSALQPCPNGISYLHLYNPATQTDLSGFSVLSSKVRVGPAPTKDKKK